MMIGLVNSLILAAALVPMPREIEMLSGVCRADAPVEIRRDASIPAEGYRLSISPGAIKIASSDAAGEFYARVTLEQLGGKDIPCCEITDAPRYRWRGCLIDEGRHFFGKASVKKMIDAMAANKLNVLHWHLTEDQGWRIDFKRWPELAKRGAVRRDAQGRIYGPHFYTEEDIAEIVEYAKARHVKIVPELEIPGHSRAALAAFPEFSCLGDRLERRADSTWGVKRELYCAGNDAAIKFLEELLDEFCRLFKYSDTIHIGGDECPKSRWRRCAKCQARIKSLGLKDESALQSWMMRHFSEYLAKKGRRAVVWEEATDGGLAGNAAVMSWLGKDRAIAAAKSGADCIVCPRTHTYFDQRQELPFDPWRADGKGLPLSKVYAFDPSEGFPAECASRILGSEGLLWTEHIEEPEELEWMAFPRLCALAEALWTGGENRDYAAFAKRLETHIARLRAMGVNSAPATEGVPVNRAVTPAPRERANGYDWIARHEYILDEARTWRTNPRIVFLGDGVFHRMAGMESIGETGDSLTRPEWKTMFAPGERVLNMSFDGDRTENILWRLEQGELKRVRPEIVVIMAGGENLRPGAEGRVDSPEEIAQAVRKIVEHVRREQPNAEVRLYGVCSPDGADYDAVERANRLNSLLSRIPSYCGTKGGAVKFFECWDAGTPVSSLDITPDGERDMTADVMAAVEAVRGAGGGAVSFAPGEYHFRSPVKIPVFISNHDNQDGHAAFLPVTNVANIAFRSKGARFVCHGEGVAFALIDTKDVAVEGIAFDYARPRFSEWRLEGGRLVSCDVQYVCETRDGKLYATGPGWRELQRLAHFFDGKTLAPLGTKWWDGTADRVFEGFPDGTIVVTRHGYRPNPCVFLYRAAHTTFQNCGAFAASGMGLLAQRCDTVTVSGWRTRGARLTGLQADATHFSNCRGTMTVENSLLEGMVDDGINVHSTALRIEKILDGGKLVCKYAHVQSTGFETFLAGETLRFIRAATMEHAGERTVESVKWNAADEIEIAVSGGTPNGIAAGDAVENADWQPAVVFRGNTVRNMSPRGSLFATPGKIVCESNLFSSVSGAAILIAADANEWYETGACRDMTIRGNTFRRCTLKGGKGVIQITPKVPRIAEQKERYHRNITICGNRFVECAKPMLFAVSASHVRLRGNTVEDSNGEMSLAGCDDVVDLDNMEK